MWLVSLKSAFGVAGQCFELTSHHKQVDSIVELYPNMTITLIPMDETKQKGKTSHPKCVGDKLHQSRKPTFLLLGITGHNSPDEKGNFCRGASC